MRQIFSVVCVMRLVSANSSAQLNLYGCASLTDASLQAIGSRLVLLEHLDLSLCSRLTDQGILSLVSSNPGGPQRPPGLARLRELKLYNCVEITDAGIQGRQRPLLQ